MEGHGAGVEGGIRKGGAYVEEVQVWKGSDKEEGMVHIWRGWRCGRVDNVCG